jgi:hypothetical protein
MVAIIGGLLVARFVSIASEQEGAQRLVEGAQGRHATARKREQEARDSLRGWDTYDFFTAKVIRAIRDGERTVPGLRKVGGYTSLTDAESADTAMTILTEFDTADTTLRAMIPTDEIGTDSPEWEEFKHIHPLLPATDWDDVWDIAYEDIVRPPQPSPTPLRLGTSAKFAYLAPRTPPEYVALDAQRRDALQADVARAQQQVEDIEAELARLQLARDKIVRPKGLGWGLVVLGFFTLVGVIVPIWLMSRGPTHLTAHLGEVVFWLFLAGLLALLGYMSALALRLSGWQRNSGDQSS